MWLGSDSWRLIQNEITRFTSVWMSVKRNQNEISGQVTKPPLDPILKTFHPLTVYFGSLVPQTGNATLAVEPNTA